MNICNKKPPLFLQYFSVQLAFSMYNLSLTTNTSVTVFHFSVTGHERTLCVEVQLVLVLVLVLH